MASIKRETIASDLIRLENDASSPKIFTPSIRPGGIVRPPTFPIPEGQLRPRPRPPGKIDPDQIHIPGKIVLGRPRFWPQPRSQMRVPISPTENVDETTLFEDPLDPAKKFTIPRFELLEETIDAHRRLGVLMEKVGETWVLTVRFVAAQRTAGVASLASNVSAILRFTPPTTNIIKDVQLTIQPVDPTRWTATYIMTTFNEMAQIYNALTQVGYLPF